MSRFVRASKYRHVYGQTGKKEFSLENVKVTNQAWDTDLISASGRYLSLNWLSAGGGAFAILPLPSPWGPPPHGLPYKIPDVIPLARGHAAPVLDTAWSPFDDSLVVSGGDDGRILVWKVEQHQFEGWGAERFEPIDFEPVARIDGSARKIGQVSFHPTASHVLASASGDHVVKLWDITDPDQARSTLGGHTDTIQSFSWNSTGTLLVTTCRDRKLRIFDARTGGDPVRITDGHGGIKGSRVVWMGERDLIATTGFSKMSDRQVAIWETGGLGNLKTVSLDQSAGVVMPFWSDNGILFLAGKGDGNIRYYEYESDTLHALSEHKSSEPQRGLCFLPRRALNVGECEIARAYKVTGSVIEPIAFVVPRKADSFQSDIFPPAPSDEPSVSATEFFAGKVAPRKFIDLETGSISQLNTPVASPLNAFASPAGGSLSSASSNFLSPTNSSLLGRASGGRSGSGSGGGGLGLPSNTVLQPPTPLQSQGLPERSLSGGAAYATSPVREREGSLSGGGDSGLAEENAKLTAELRAARTQIRNLELQVEQMRANAQRAAKVLMEASGA